MGTLRDALVAALSLDTFNRHADKVDMANVAQLINNLHSLFLADGDRFVATPTFHVYTMYRRHQGAKGVRIVVQGARGDVPGGSTRREDLPAGRIGLARRGEGGNSDPGSYACDRARRGCRSACAAARRPKFDTPCSRTPS